MARTKDPAREARDRLLRRERQASAQAEIRAVSDGVAETVALARARGAAIAPSPGPRGARTGPLRRYAGLDWLARKGRLSPAQKQAGERYGACWRRAGHDPSIPSTLEVQPGAAAGGAALADMLAHADGTAHAARRLALFRRRLSGQRDLIAACDRICGQEMTPREAAAGDHREGARIEAVLGVALDMLAGAG
ncbi:hypothetical protein [Phenylobacterium sp.]|uniref:hypothetical protein n=1 Tax=Phenylobacterium sp. TaxID=1871053 RepID=UPI00398337F0